MRAFGSKRTFGGCTTIRQRASSKIKICVGVKNRKRDRIDLTLKGNKYVSI